MKGIENFAYKSIEQKKAKKTIEIQSKMFADRK